jgi:GAF domain-containing protein
LCPLAHRRGELDLLALDPPRPDLDGARLALDDFPRLQEALEGLGASFVPDALESTYGAGLDFVRRLGIRSSLRTPVVISGVSELVLAVSWQMVVSEPDPATIAVVRRFADQAGLALEQLERRRAQNELAARADATRRLQDVTAALSQAATSLDVSNTCLEHALAWVGAEAGFIVLNGPEGTRSVELVASSGYDDDELEAWRAFDLDADVPFAKAIASGEPIWALTPDEMAASTGVTEPRSCAWATLPLVTRLGARGALHLSLRHRREPTAAEREWLQALVSQCGQALERSGHYEEEQRLRLRAERLQGITALLSNAVTPTDVANVLAEEVAAAVDTTSIAVASLQEGEVTGVLASQGNGAEIVSTVFEPELGSGAAGARMLGGGRTVLLDFEDSARSGSPEVEEALARAQSKTLLLVPLVAGRRANGLLLAAWDRSIRLSADDRGIIEAFAGQAALALDRARQFESEQVVAETLQRSVLPVSLPHVDGVRMAARYLPGSEQLDVGGDWFDALQLPDGKLGLVVGDVVGKGVEAAASMSQLRNAIRAFSLERLKPPSVLARLNRLANEVLDTSFATVAYLVLDPASGVCRSRQQVTRRRSWRIPMDASTSSRPRGGFRWVPGSSRSTARRRSRYRQAPSCCSTRTASWSAGADPSMTASTTS